ncbi:MAG TPA: hypothetical protein VFN31_01125 [Candidatus Saccharimonadales bacterium]|nr:hypothetical protein [Candidatus Saccharimonadales bacterium]
MQSSQENLASSKDQDPSSSKAFNIVEDGVIPFSVAFTAGDLIVSLGNQVYRATEHATPPDPKTLLALGFATFCTLAFNSQR